MSVKPSNTEEYISKVFEEKTGNSFDELYKKYNNSLVYNIFLKCKDENQAKDLAADTWERSMDQISKYEKSKGAFNTWLFKVAHNIFLQLKKDQSTNPHFSIDNESEDGMSYKDLIPATEGNLFEQSITFKKAEIAKQRISEMPEAYKNVLHRYHIEGMKYEEISAELNINLSTVKSQIKMGRAKLIKILEVDFKKLEFEINKFK